MKTIVLAGVTLAALAVSLPADAARHHAYRGIHHGYAPAFGGAYGAAVPRRGPGSGLFYDQGNFVNGDPDPFIQGQVLRDPDLGNQGAQ